MGAGGLEPLLIKDEIYSLAAVSERLSVPIMYTLMDSNHRHLPCKESALTNWAKGAIVVHKVGLEPTRRKAPVPKTGVTTNSTTRAKCGLLLSSYHKTTHILMGSSIRCFTNQHFWRRTACDPAGIRTLDPYIKSVLLYQLSYEVKYKCGRFELLGARLFPD